MSTLFFIDYGHEVGVCAQSLLPALCALATMTQIRGPQKESFLHQMINARTSFPSE